MNIVLIDDEPIIHQSLTPFLQRSGHCVHSATDGVEGLALVADGAPDLVISDVKMPHMDGLELLAALRVRNPALPVVLITGHSDVATATSALDNGAFAFLRKPVKLDELTRIVSRVAERQQLESDLLQATQRLAHISPEQAAAITPEGLAQNVRSANDALRSDLDRFQQLWVQTEPALRKHLEREVAIAELLAAMPEIMSALDKSSQRIIEAVNPHRSQAS